MSISVKLKIICVIEEKNISKNIWNNCHFAVSWHSSVTPWAFFYKSLHPIRNHDPVGIYFANRAKYKNKKKPQCQRKCTTHAHKYPPPGLDTYYTIQTRSLACERNTSMTLIQSQWHTLASFWAAVQTPYLMTTYLNCYSSYFSMHTVGG